MKKKKKKTNWSIANKNRTDTYSEYIVNISSYSVRYLKSVSLQRCCVYCVYAVCNFHFSLHIWIAMLLFFLYHFNTHVLAP